MLEISVKSFRVMIIKCSEKERQTLLNGKTETFNKVKYILKRNKQMYKRHYWPYKSSALTPWNFHKTLLHEKREEQRILRVSLQMKMRMRRSSEGHLHMTNTDGKSCR